MRRGRDKCLVPGDLPDATETTLLVFHTRASVVISQPTWRAKYRYYRARFLIRILFASCLTADMQSWKMGTQIIFRGGFCVPCGVWSGISAYLEILVKALFLRLWACPQITRWNFVWGGFWRCEYFSLEEMTSQKPRSTMAFVPESLSRVASSDLDIPTLLKVHAFLSLYKHCFDSRPKQTQLAWNQCMKMNLEFWNRSAVPDVVPGRIHVVRHSTTHSKYHHSCWTLQA